MIEIIAVIIGLVLLVYLNIKDDEYEEERVKKRLLAVKPSLLYFICLFLLFILLFIA